MSLPPPPSIRLRVNVMVGVEEPPMLDRRNLDVRSYMLDRRGKD